MSQHNQTSNKIHDNSNLPGHEQLVEKFKSNIEKGLVVVEEVLGGYEEKPAPGLPTIQEEIKRSVVDPVTYYKSGNPLSAKKLLPSLYVMMYRDRQHPKCEQTFVFDGDINAAKQRAKSHCAIMGYTFFWVRPFTSDLDAIEKTFLNRKN